MTPNQFASPLIASADPTLHTVASPVVVEPGLIRLYTLRLCYVILAVGIGLTFWPIVFNHTSELALRSGVKFSLLAALGATAVLGLRYPVRMIPLLIFELTWKAIYLLAFALPLWRAHQLTAAAVEDIQACLMVVVLLPLIPWRYVFATYALSSGDRWR